MNRINYLPLSLLAVLAACGGDSNLDTFLGSFNGTATTTLVPDVGTSRTVVSTDVLVNGSDLTADDAPGDLQLVGSGDWSCLFIGVVDGDDAAFDEVDCQVTEGGAIADLDASTATARRVGDTLTIELAGDYTVDLESGSFSSSFSGLFEPGTAP